MGIETPIQIKKEDVTSVYSGKYRKCMCGCSGKYSYATEHRAWAGDDRGYELEDEDISDRSITIIYNKVYKLIAMGEIMHQGTGYLGVDDLQRERTYTIYFKPKGE